ncbi:MAG TPA: DUF4433 domain-containing protein [Cellvibrio sp.]|nr:DUF4433 domain-containing protein [Cellvibrio sp.]
MNKQEIKKFARELDIPYLLHFTHISNLESILENGLYSRETVDAMDQEIITNDAGRYDGRINTISLSIAHPNDRMFTKYRGVDEDWCVLALHRKLLWELDCLFFKYNAADGRISGKSDDELSGIDAFRSMYEELDELDSREGQCLEPYDPTDKQAEVLVIDYIPVDYIFGVVVSNRQVKKNYKDILEGYKVAINSPGKGVYASRLYRRKWQ